MLFLKSKSDKFNQFVSFVRPSIENHDAVFLLESSSEISAFNGENFCFYVEDISEKELAKINLSNIQEIIIFYDSTNTSAQKLSPFDKFKNITKLFDLSIQSSAEVFIRSAIRNREFKEENRNLKTSINKISSRLEQITDVLDAELLKVKKIYKTFVPFRQSSLKTIDLKSKFFTGESSGGEFFDLIENGRKVILVASFASSYLLSSCYLTHFQVLKSSNKIDDKDINLFLETVKAEYEAIKLSSKKEVLFEHLIFIIDQNTLEVSYMNFGNYSLYSSKGLVMCPSNSDKFQKLVLKRGESYYFVSPGLIKNWEHYGNKKLLSQLFEENTKLNTADMLDELSINLKENVQGQFLKFDSTMISLEVKENAIHQV